MVLEETLIFQNDADADLFIRFLKKKGSRAIRKVESHPFEEMVVRGSICDLIALLDGVVAADPDIRADFEIPLILSNMRQTREYIAELMAQFGEGEMIPAARLRSDRMEEKEEKVMEEEAALEEISEPDLALAVINAIGILEKHHLISWSQAGCTLVKRADPDTLSVCYQVDDLTPFTGDLLNEHRLALIPKVTMDTCILVSTEPSLYRTCTFDEVREVLDDLKVEEESLERFFWNFAYKSFAVEQLLDLVAKEGRISLSALIERVASQEMELAEDDDDQEEPILLTLTPAFITALVHDLRKATILEGTEQKIRLAP